MPDEHKSPAVQSMENEQEEQRFATTNGELDQALENSFPASDPLSMTSTGTSSGRTDAREASRVRDNADAYPIEPLKAARNDAGRLLGDVRSLVRENPLTAAGTVAAIAFVYGATR